MIRRDFLTLLGGAAVAAPFTVSATAEAQQTETPYRLGLVPLGSPSNKYDQSLVEAFRQGLREVGLIEDRHVLVDVGH